MKSFLYYIPDLTEAKTTDLKEKGLLYAFRDADYHSRGVSGPDGQRGVVVSINPDIGKIAYVADQQIWRRIPKSDCWIGYWKNELPSERDLAMPRLIEGELVKLLDDLKWMVPIARKLPRRIDLNEDGDYIQGPPKPEFSSLFDLAGSYVDHLMVGEQSDGSISFEFAELIDLAVAGLSVNYRISRIETAILGLLDELVAVEVAQTVIDFKGMMELAKKKYEESVGSSSTNGPEAETADTVPAGLT